VEHIAVGAEADHPMHITDRKLPDWSRQCDLIERFRKWRGGLHGRRARGRAPSIGQQRRADPSLQAKNPPK
jgi:hypothetical protein